MLTQFKILSFILQPEEVCHKVGLLSECRVHCTAALCKYLVMAEFWRYFAVLRVSAKL